MHTDGVDGRSGKAKQECTFFMLFDLYLSNAESSILSHPT